jgi:hypothetical protein
MVNQKSSLAIKSTLPSSPCRRAFSAKAWKARRHLVELTTSKGDTMRCIYFNSLRPVITALRLSVVGAAAVLAACVAPIPIKDQAPKVSYATHERVAVAVVDARPILKTEKKPATYIGVARPLFGIPTDMQIYPWVALKEEKSLTLAQELEQRIAEALQSTGANVVRIDAAAHVDADSAKRSVQSLGADRVLLISLDAWAVDINLSWVGSFDLDWGYTVEISDSAGAPIATFKDSGTDVVKEQGSDSPRNMVTAAFRARLEKLLDRPEVRTGLSIPERVARRETVEPLERGSLPSQPVAPVEPHLGQ